MTRIPTMSPAKDPDETRAYSIDWSDHLGSATISTSTWAVEQGSVAVSSDSETSTVATVVLTGGTVGEVAQLRNTMVSSAGETLKQSIRVCVRKR
jgi:hypothetical protein